jgi:hypothetical protein
MDFIGQRGPSSKLHLLALDFVIILLQVVHLSAYLARQRLRKEGTSERLLAVFSADQDLEDEERGVRHSVELQELGVRGRHLSDSADSGIASGSNGVSASEALLSMQSDEHLMDVVNCGQAVLADLDLVKTFQEQLMSSYKGTSPERDRAESRRVLAEQLAGLRLQWSR